MVQLVSVAVPAVEQSAAADVVPELPLMVQLVSVAVPLLTMPPPFARAVLPLTVQLVIVVVPSLRRPPPPRRSRPQLEPELSLRVQSVSVAVPCYG